MDQVETTAAPGYRRHVPKSRVEPFRPGSSRDESPQNFQHKAVTTRHTGQIWPVGRPNLAGDVNSESPPRLRLTGQIWPVLGAVLAAVSGWRAWMKWAILAASTATAPATSQADSSVHRCASTHPEYRESAAIALRDGMLTGFDWITNGPGGSCRFTGRGFTHLQPDLIVHANGCRVHLWSQDSHHTVALDPSTPQCRSFCTTARAFEALLPLTFSGKSGMC